MDMTELFGAPVDPAEPKAHPRYPKRPERTEQTAYVIETLVTEELEAGFTEARGTVPSNLLIRPRKPSIVT